MFPFPVAPFRGIALCLAALVAGAGLSARTLTSADGRAIEAEVLGFEGTEKVKIKRADTGRTFTLPIDSFAEKDREALLAEAKAEAAKPPPPPAAGDIVVDLGRRTKSAKTVKIPVWNEYTDDSRRETGTIHVTNGEASYSVTLVNRTKRPIADLRIDYVLFAETDSKRNIQATPSLSQQTGRALLKELPAFARESLATVPIATRKTDLKGEVNWIQVGKDYAPIELKGIWLRVYQGEHLVLENSTPTTLAESHPWPEIAPASAPSPSPLPPR